MALLIDQGSGMGIIGSRCYSRIFVDVGILWDLTLSAILFCWCWLVFLEVVDCFRCSLDVEVFQCVFFGFWVNFLMFLPVDV